MLSTKVAVIAAHGVEECELVSAMDLWIRAGLQVDLITIEATDLINGAHDINIQATHFFAQVKWDDYQMIFLPGGGQNVARLLNFKPLLKVIVQFYEQQRFLAAICAAPQVLGKAGVTMNKNITAYPGCYQYLDVHYIIENAKVVVDGKLITGNGIGGVIDFALKIITLLVNESTMLRVKKEILWVDV